MGLSTVLSVFGGFLFRDLRLLLPHPSMRLQNPSHNDAQARSDALAKMRNPLDAIA
jgi:hypothetical protein